MTNWLDRAIDSVAPVWGAKRHRARVAIDIMSDSSFVGASSTHRSLQNWTPRAKSADDDIGSGSALSKLRARSRDLNRNDALAAGIGNTIVLSTIGGGLKLQPKPDWKAAKLKTEEAANEWGDNTSGLWRLWAESTNCDITRTQNFYGLQELAFRSCLESGDVFTLLAMVQRDYSMFQLSLQMIEADLVTSKPGTLSDAKNRIVEGVELDAVGAPIAYHVVNYYPGTSLAFAGGKSRRLRAFTEDGRRREVLHMFDRRRPGQTRGYPLCAPIIEKLKSLSAYSEAELKAALVNAFLTAFVKSERGIGDQETGKVTRPDNFELGSGNILELVPGEDVQSVGVTRPNAGFDPFVLAILRQCGAAVGVPHEVIIKHFTASYSAARAALLEAWRFFRNRRHFVADAFCTPVYEAWLEEAIGLGLISAPGFFDDPAIRAAYLQCEWTGDAAGQINPVDEIDAAERRIKAKLSTREQETMELTGRVFDDNVRQLAKEEKMLRDSGLSVETDPAPKPGPTPDQREKKQEDTDAA
jgi:lambda family phage portal protein